jgi:hypothetical protein
MEEPQINTKTAKPRETIAAMISSLRCCFVEMAPDVVVLSTKLKVVSSQNISGEVPVGGGGVVVVVVEVVVVVVVVVVVGVVVVVCPATVVVVCPGIAVVVVVATGVVVVVVVVVVGGCVVTGAPAVVRFPGTQGWFQPFT